METYLRARNFAADMAYYAIDILRQWRYNILMSSEHTVIETPGFIRDAKAAGLDDAERWAIVSMFSANPTSGEEIKGTGGARKTRVGGRGKGKSGGYRVISFYSGDTVPVFLLNVFGKGERVDLSQAERNELRTELAGLVDDYRKGVSRHVKRR